MPHNITRSHSVVFNDTADTRLGKLYSELSQNHQPDSGSRLLLDGQEALQARLALAAMADRSIDAQYYLIENDNSSGAFLNELLNAADRGVRVRLLVDDINMAGKDSIAAALAGHPNLSIRLFNPFARNAPRVTQILGKVSTITRRMHNKSFTVDNQLSILGGRNIGDSYFEANPLFDFDDVDVLLLGPVVDQVSESFDSYWNDDLAYPVQTLVDNKKPAGENGVLREQLPALLQQAQKSAGAERFSDSRIAKELDAGTLGLNWGAAQVVSDDPEKLRSDRSEQQYRLSPKLRQSIGEVESSILIISPYFIPGQDGLQILTALSERGVKIRILTNALSSTDVALVHAGYAKYRKPLLRAGIELYELNLYNKLIESGSRIKLASSKSTSSLHAKTYVFDLNRAFIGSMNFDRRSIVENSEIGVVLYSPQTANEISQWFDNNVGQIAFKLELKENEFGHDSITWTGQTEDGEVVFTKDPYSSAWLRMGIRILGVLPFEPLL